MIGMGCSRRRLEQGPGVNSEPYRMFNLDVFEYLVDSPFGLYGSIPFMMAHGTKGSTVCAARARLRTAHGQSQWLILEALSRQRERADRVHNPGNEIERSAFHYFCVYLAPWPKTLSLLTCTPS